MCAICLQTPCHPRCPNAPEPEPMYWCCECGEGIFEGDKYFQYGNSEICEACMDEKTTEEMLELFEERLRTA